MSGLGIVRSILRTCCDQPEKVFNSFSRSAGTTQFGESHESAELNATTTESQFDTMRENWVITWHSPFMVAPFSIAKVNTCPPYPQYI
jgi:hypothetical protein